MNKVYRVINPTMNHNCNITVMDDGTIIDDGRTEKVCMRDRDTG